MDRVPDGALMDVLDAAGPVAGALAAEGRTFEIRPQQTEMAAAVGRALSSNRHLIVEAGTGVGKSFAYLVPLLAWAHREDKTVAVATSTIALQEQLVRRDLPLLEAALPFEVSFALVKGRGNYLCTRRMLLALEGGEQLFDSDGGQLDAIRRWSLETREGSRQDLPFRPAEGVWELVKAEQGNCKGRACDHYARCHYQRSRRRAHAVRCLVLNHHVLMADLALRRSGASFLPKVDALVVDEAHDLEDTAAAHLGLRVSSVGVAQVLGRLWNPERGRGLLKRTAGDAVRNQVAATRDVARRFFRDLGDWAGDQGGRADAVALPDAFPVEPTLGRRAADLAASLSSTASGAGDEDTSLELAAASRRLQELGITLDALAAPREGEVRWLERSHRGAVAVATAPIDVAPALEQVLWGRHDTVVLTSATLTTGRPPSFAFLRRRIGPAEADELTVGSPFDYTRQARVVVRPGMPDPVRSAAAFEAALAPAVREAVRSTSGGAFVLFTGYESLRRTAAAVRSDLEADGLEVLVQGEGLERAALLERFRANDAVLFGVASFWQGVDVPGSALRHVIIARLPFEVPTHPLQQARRAHAERGGRDAFRELSLPVAALRLKQGFGRLIRGATDTGTVTILDPRIATRSYGRYLLESLPECPVLSDDEPTASRA